MRKIVHFEPSARLQSILSRELVADPNVAVIEFVKNGYDAGATCVMLDFELGDHASEGILTVADDGEGMDLAEFEQNWLRPGYSEKAMDSYVGRRGRVPAGEKGLGRLAAGRLGEVLNVWTRKDSEERWLHAEFVWSEFDDMNQALRDIEIPVDDESEPSVIAGDTGTVIEISGLRLNWDAKVPGRKVPGRHPTRIGRLRQDLEMLLLPLAAGDEDFEIWVDHNSSQPDDDPSGLIQPPSLDLIHYRYDFEIVPRGKKWQVKRTIKRGTELLADADSIGQKLKKKETHRVGLTSSVEGVDISEVGPFSGSLLYAPDSADRLRRLRAPVGVLLYRDGIRVEPYGQPGNDWLGAQARKASRQGYAAIQPAALYGAVHITRADNSGLRSQANREGLIETDIYDAFIQICRTEFTEFEELVFEEYLEPRWQSIAERRQSDAQATQSYALSLTRALMHSINQPVATANTSLDRLQTLIDSRVSNQRLRKELQELHDSTATQLSQISAAIRRVLDMVDFDSTAKHVNISELVEEVANHEREPRITVNVDISRKLTAHVPPSPVREALLELVANSAVAGKSSKRNCEVQITASEDPNLISLVVADNGPGVPDKIRADLFKRASSTRGQIGMGLIIVRQLLRLIGGDVALVKTDADGSEFEITLPKESA